MSGVFEGLDVVVTGGTGALGTGVVGMLRDLGARCHVTCVIEEELERFVHRDDAQVSVTRIDLTDESAVELFYADLPAIWASIHIAGGFAMAPIDRTSAEAFGGQFAMNAMTCFLCCREAVKKMRTHAGRSAGPGLGRIVNVAARPAVEPRAGAGMVAYTVSKSAVTALTLALGEEVAGDGILVNAVVPSIIDTPANRAAMPDADHASWASPEQIARTMVFLASPENTVSRCGLVPV